jgi:GNAT superfamily N-acetyltransferase
MHGEQQVGFARVVTDYAAFAWISDVLVLEDYRGRGLSKWMLETIIAHPALQNLRLWLLGTKDAHELYARYAGFTMVDPTRFMERRDAQVYQRLKTGSSPDA